MLIEFKVQNFRSFDGEQSIGFLTTADKALEHTHCQKTGIMAIPRVAKVAAIFGPNGSGKSNLLEALATLRDLVVNASEFTPPDFAERYTPFQLRKVDSMPTRFSIEIALNQVRYRYSLAYDQSRIVSEALFVYRTGKPQRWFERRAGLAPNSESWVPFSSHFKGPHAVWRKSARERIPFLTTAAQLNAEQVAPLFRWFASGMDVVSSAESGLEFKQMSAVRGETYRTHLVSFLRASDLRIDDVRVVAAEAGAAGPAHLLCRHVRRDGSHFWLKSDDESAGTRRLLRLFEPLFEAIERGKLLLVDEMDSHLHPVIARYLINLFNDPQMSAAGAQLMLTSHDTTLMDLSILRRDEVWLMQLSSGDASSVTSLAKSHPRRHELIGKGYLRGRYGGLPVPRPIFGFLAHAPTDGTASNGNSRSLARKSAA